MERNCDYRRKVSLFIQFEQRFFRYSKRLGGKPKKSLDQVRVIWLLNIPDVLVRLDHVACIVVNANQRAV